MNNGDATFQELRIMVAEQRVRIDTIEVTFQKTIEAQRENIAIALAAIKETTIVQKENMALTLQAAKEAVTKAEVSVEKRFESVNEFRAQLGDQARTFIPRQEFDVQHNAILQRVGAVEGALLQRIASIENFQRESISRRGGVSEGWGWAVGALGFVVALLTLAFHFMK